MEIINRSEAHSCDFGILKNIKKSLDPQGLKKKQEPEKL